MWLAGQRRGQPIETGCDAFAGEGRASENLPRPIAERRQVEGIGYFRGRHATAHVLLVRPHEDRRALQVFIRRNPVQLCARQRHAIAVITVDHKNERISRSHVLGPARTERRLSTDVPQQELEVLVLKRLGIRADRRAVATTEPSVILYIIVVLPALSRPKIHILSSFCPKSEAHRLLNATPMD